MENYKDQTTKELVEMISELKDELKEVELKWIKQRSEYFDLYNEGEEHFKVYTDFIIQKNLKEEFLSYIESCAVESKIHPHQIDTFESYFLK